MNGEELTARCVKLFGKAHWKKNLAERSDVDSTTVRRWARSAYPVPRYIEVLLDNIETERKLARITANLAKQLR